jgi:glycosyltransferase involved in cell wall biosynthesis
VNVVHSNTTAVFSGVLAARLSGVPHVWHVHEITTRPTWFARLLAAAVGLLTDRAVFVSKASLEHMCRLSPRVRPKARLIHNGVDADRARDGRRGVLRAELGWTEGHPVVGMIGRINWWKGQGAFVDAAALLAKRLPQARFVLVGGTFEADLGPLDELLARIRTAGLQDSVVVQDFRADIGNVLADIDVFALPSTEPDPFPTVVLEAMAAARPVVGFAHGGVLEMVEPGVTGLLVAPCDVAALAAAIGQIIDQPDRGATLGRAGRERVQRLFTPAAYVGEFVALYRELAASRGGRLR